MSDPLRTLSDAVSSAILLAFGEEHADVDPLVRPSANPRFGDYQANVAMPLAKRVGANPRQVARKLIEAIDVADLCQTPDIAGPGFINFNLTDAAVAALAGELAGDERLGVPTAADAQRVVVDYSSPNVAKEMHVGHLRSTIIGDCIVRVLAALGHDCIRQNHVGDWGTQFGMLIEHLIDAGQTDVADPQRLTEMYRQSKQRFDADADFADRAKRRVVQLQGGDEQTVTIWRSLVRLSIAYFDSVYRRMGVQLTPDDVRGESFYNDRLAGVVERLDAAGQLHQSRGARVVYPQGFTGEGDEPMGMIVRKSDGGYLYATTDLAAACYRVDELNVDRVIYVIGLPQKQHIAMLTQTLRQAGWIEDRHRFDYVGFGSVLGEDGKMFRTRSGETVRLIDLLDEAERRAAEIVRRKNPDLPADEQAQVAHLVGIGAIKYADLSSDRIKDYTFAWDRMLAMEGNTAPYLQYAYARIRSIFRKAPPDAWATGQPPAPLRITDPAERALVLKLAQLGPTVASVADNLEPHHLCNYLYDLATSFSKFYETCPVLNADDTAMRDSRLVLCDTTAGALKLVLGLLGIDVPQRM